MGGMSVDLGELEQFLYALQRFEGQVGDSVSQLSSHLQQLGTDWRDDKYWEFYDKWDDALRVIKSYLDESPRNVAFIRQKAEAVEEYLR